MKRGGGSGGIPLYVYLLYFQFSFSFVLEELFKILPTHVGVCTEVQGRRPRRLWGDRRMGCPT